MAATTYGAVQFFFSLYNVLQQLKDVGDWLIDIEPQGLKNIFKHASFCCIVNFFQAVLKIEIKVTGDFFCFFFYFYFIFWIFKLLSPFFNFGFFIRTKLSVHNIKIIFFYFTQCPLYDLINWNKSIYNLLENYIEQK